MLTIKLRFTSPGSTLSIRRSYRLDLGHCKGNNLEEGIPPGWKHVRGGVNSGGGANGLIPNSTAAILSRLPQITAVNSAHIYFPRLLSI